MSLTVTLHAWWLLAYLAVGAVLYVPLYWLSWRHMSNRDSFWVWLEVMHHRDWGRLPVGIALWPVMVKEELL